jgi:hypothetical protein
LDAGAVRVRLYWHDGRQEDVDIVDGTTEIIRQTPEGHRHFAYTDEEDEDGASRFIEEDDRE